MKVKQTYQQLPKISLMLERYILCNLVFNLLSILRQELAEQYYNLNISCYHYCKLEHQKLSVSVIHDAYT